MSPEVPQNLKELDIAKLAGFGIDSELRITPFFNGSGILFSVGENNMQVEKAVLRARKIALVISGPSSAGKDSIVDGLVKKYGEVFERVKTCTTRQEIRPDEIEDPYIRMTASEFSAAVKRGEFLEHAPYAGEQVGTNRKVVEAALEGGKIPIFRVDPQGAKSLVEFWQKGDPLFKDCVVIYLSVVPESWWQLARRLLKRDVFDKAKDNRQQAREKVRTRWDQIKEDVGRMSSAHLFLINKKDRLNESVEEVKRLIDHYKNKLKDRKKLKL